MIVHDLALGPDRKVSALEDFVDVGRGASAVQHYAEGHPEVVSTHHDLLVRFGARASSSGSWLARVLLRRRRRTGHDRAHVSGTEAGGPHRALSPRASSGGRG